MVLVVTPPALLTQTIKTQALAGNGKTEPAEKYFSAGSVVNNSPARSH
jgi:hypothetical protein